MHFWRFGTERMDRLHETEGFGGGGISSTSSSTQGTTDVDGAIGVRDFHGRQREAIVMYNDSIDRHRRVHGRNDLLPFPFATRPCSGCLWRVGRKGGSRRDGAVADSSQSASSRQSSSFWPTRVCLCQNWRPVVLFRRQPGSRRDMIPKAQLQPRRTLASVSVSGTQSRSQDTPILHCAAADCSWGPSFTPLRNTIQVLNPERCSGATGCCQGLSRAIAEIPMRAPVKERTVRGQPPASTERPTMGAWIIDPTAAATGQWRFWHPA